MNRRLPNHHPTRSAAASKIQSAYLTFQIRKSFNPILHASRRVDSIQRRICHEATFDLITNDPQERLKVNEALMKLILTLDSLTIHHAVRTCRKTVIKKAIALQEALDELDPKKLEIDDDDCVIVEPVRLPGSLSGDFGVDVRVGKLVEENERLMGMVKEVFERNQAQAESIRALTARVEKLERDGMEEKLQKMRKRRHDIINGGV